MNHLPPLNLAELGKPRRRSISRGRQRQQRDVRARSARGDRRSGVRAAVSKSF